MPRKKVGNSSEIPARIIDMKTGKSVDTSIPVLYRNIRRFREQFGWEQKELAQRIGVTGNAGQANYSAAKAGVIGFTKTVAKELASRGIAANAVAPGFIDTDMTSVLSDKAKEAALSGIPLGRMGTPDDIAAAVLFLVSDHASYITGQVLNVDGGMVM